jgi:hypothetical protein
VRTALVDHVEHFRWRVLQDALAEATAAYWERRAVAFDAIGTPACDDVALACRRYAWLLRDAGVDAEAQATIIAAAERIRLAS